MSKSSQVRCEHCDELIIKSSHLATSGGRRVRSYHYWCLKDLREDQYKKRKRKKKYRRETRWVNSPERTTLLSKLSILWVVFFLFLIVPGGVELFTRMGCRRYGLRGYRNYCPDQDMALLGTTIGLIIILILLAIPFAQRLLSWNRFEKHFDDDD